FLEGTPDMTKRTGFKVGKDVPEMLESDLRVEYEEEHLDWIETQEYQIDAMGIENYLQAQVMGDD
ncbi:MAG: bacterioferritin, partial [Pseudomonadota bacterium]|nr:bacterioferritin [Pseudomonadota bacterium]